MNTTSLQKIDLRTLPVMARHKMSGIDLPANYIAAREALQACVNVDECKDIADKHEAIANYARQARDTRLCEYANRIQLRAITRIGDLLNNIPDPSRRVRAATDAGMSKRQRYRSIHLAGSIPRVELDAEIECSPPASRARLDLIAKNYRSPPHPVDVPLEGVRQRDTTAEYHNAIGVANRMYDMAISLKPLTMVLADDERERVLTALVKAADEIDAVALSLEVR